MGPQELHRAESRNDTLEQLIHVQSNQTNNMLKLKNVQEKKPLPQGTDGLPPGHQGSESCV